LRKGARNLVARAQTSIAQNACAQTTATVQEFFHARRDRVVHPVTGPTFTGRLKPDTLYFKILTDQLVKIYTTGHNIPPKQRRRAALQFKRVTEVIENFDREEGDLSFVAFPIIEEAIASNAATSDAFDFWDFDGRMIVGRAAVVAKEIVAVRNIKMADFQFGHVIFGRM